MSHSCKDGAGDRERGKRSERVDWRTATNAATNLIKTHELGPKSTQGKREQRPHAIGTYHTHTLLYSNTGERATHSGSI